MKCRYSSCGNAVVARQLCRTHYSRHWGRGDIATFKKSRVVPEKRSCVREGCNRKVQARQWCTNHYSTAKRRGLFTPVRKKTYSRIGVCRNRGCTRPRDTFGLCTLHYSRRRHTGKTGGKKRLHREK